MDFCTLSTSFLAYESMSEYSRSFCRGLVSRKEVVSFGLAPWLDLR